MAVAHIDPPLAFEFPSQPPIFGVLRRPVEPALAALIGVEYFGLAVSRQRFVQRLYAKARVHRVRQSPRQNRAARPVNHRHKIQEPMLHRDVGHVDSPHVVGLGDRHIAQQIRVYLMARRGLAGVRTGDQRDDVHHPHQPLHALAAKRAAFLVEFELHPPRAVERQLEMQFVSGPPPSSPWPLGQEIPFNRQLADLGVETGLFALSLFLAPIRHDRAARKKARGIIENELLPGVNLVRMNPVPLGQLSNCRVLGTASRPIFAFTAASNFLRVFVMPLLHRLRQTRTRYTLTTGPENRVHFTR